MLRTIALVLPLLALVFSAPTPADDSAVESLKAKGFEISDFKFKQSSVEFNFKDPSSKVKTSCSAYNIPTAYTACENSNVAFKFAAGDKSSDFTIDLKETYISGSTYIVAQGSKNVKDNNPKKFNVPITNVYPFQPFELPGVGTFAPSGRPGSSPYAYLNFTITDVNGNGKATTTCNTQWISGQAPEQRDIQCTDSNFTFRFTQFSSIGQFTLALSHTYFLKPSASPRITTSATIRLDTQVPDPNFKCVFGGSGVGSCGIAEGKSPLKAPITSVSGI